MVMWRCGWPGLGDHRAALASGWANRQELTLAREFVDRLDATDEDRGGRLQLEFEGTDAAGKRAADDLAKFFKGKTVLGMPATIGVADQPDGPSVACRVRLGGDRGSGPDGDQRRQRP